MIRAHMFLGVIVCCIGGAVTIARAAQPVPSAPPAAQSDTPDQAAARAAATEFAIALSDSDLAKAKGLFGGSDEEFKHVQTTHATMRAAIRLKAAAAKAFPEEAAKARPSNDLSIDAMKNQIANQPLKVDGNEAKFSNDGMRLKKIDGKWKVVDMYGDGPNKSIVPAIMSVMAKAANDTADETEQGKFKSMAEMNKAMQARVRAAMMAIRPPGPIGPATRPTTPPAR